ncbi:photosystem I reaction center subunit N, chloroplastic isoform X2 [Vicia villosa]|uniref:photosystem I reaction center subunit N, chloroplastic isoform X2 n=1 Tax=Vicia villosa TaxID=3911 RepID=UPI00273BE164|nr:photosystem I reaction center subunit N, chloroplastic isoform X2 [Vicia villosa]
MAAMNSSVLACSYAISGSDLNAKLISMPSVATPVGVSGSKLPSIKAQQARIPKAKQSEGRRNALALLAATLFTTAVSANNSSANASVFDEYLEKSKANKELNDKKRLATSGANFARAYTVQFGTCKFPENFTGCQDLAKQKYHSFLKIWILNVKEKTNTSVVLMFSGNGEKMTTFYLPSVALFELYPTSP